jgi:hypothetical protein
MKFSTTSLRAIVLGIVFAQIGIVSASRSDKRDGRFLPGIDRDQYWQWYWLPQLSAAGIQCGGTSMKTGDGGEYRCFKDGEGICRDKNLGSFGPGQWTFGIVDGTVTLFTPANEIVWRFCSDVTHVCIGEDHGTDNGQWYSKERPYLFFYDENTHTYVGELTCDGTDGDDGKNLGKPSILKMVELSHLGQYVDYGEEGIAVTKFKKGKTEDPFDNNALFEILVQNDGTTVTAEGFWNTDKCVWYQECNNCGDEPYEDFEFELNFDLGLFCAENIPLDEDVKVLMEEVLRKFLNEDSECFDIAAGVIGCVDDVFIDVNIIEFINSNETCGTEGGTNSLPTSRMLSGEEGGVHRSLQRLRRSRRSRGRARGRGRCRRCQRRNRSSKNRKLLEIDEPSSPKTDERSVRRLALAGLPDLDNLQCPADLANFILEQDPILFANVSVAEVTDFIYLDATFESCLVNEDCPNGQICDETICEPGCLGNEDCPKGTFCDGNICEPGCSDNSDCPPGTICSPLGVCLGE